MSKFLYLNSVEHIRTWTTGGQAPLRLASSYLSQERRGTLTPDECRIRTTTADPHSVWAVIQNMFVGTTPENCDLDKVTVFSNGAASISDKFEDGLILCLSNSFDVNAHANRYPKDACVRIPDIDRLKETLDEALGSSSIMGRCHYTDTHERDPFTKGVADSWQDEFRIYWSHIKEEKLVAIPAGLCVEQWRRTTEPRPTSISSIATPPIQRSRPSQNRNQISGITIIGPNGIYFPPPGSNHKEEGES